jgi:phosphate acetyltransferase
MLMQGSLASDELLDAVRAQPGLATGRRLSHVFHAELPLYDRPLLIADALLPARPGLAEKADIVHNAVTLGHALGMAAPRVPVLAAEAAVRADSMATVDAAALCKIAERGQIAGARLGGPMPFDCAVSPAAVRRRGLDPAVAGRAEILIAPDQETGSLLATRLAYLAGAALCGVVMGARVPHALHRRDDTIDARTAAVALARLAAHHGPAASSDVSALNSPQRI